MSKVLNVENGNYIVKVEPGENIILDTSRGQTNDDNELIGKVIINGQLDVKGTTTSIKSTDLIINDNIIVLNKYDVPTGISTVLDGTAGIEIDRGENGARVRLVWDEAITWDMGGDSGQGTFKIENDGYGILPWYTNGIKSPGTLFVDVGNEVISVTNSISYEEKCFTYVGGVITDPGTGNVAVDDDSIPNVKAVIDYVTYAFENIGTGAILSSYDTSVIAYDFEFDGDPSRIELTVDGVLKVKVDEFTVDFPGLQFTDNQIAPMNLTDNLVLAVNDGSAVVIDKTLDIKETAIGSDPTPPAEGVRLYTQTEGPGDTGIYYVNKDETKDEIISRNRSLVFSMLF